ncbi:ribulokinase [Aquisalinus flavus]|uniref:Ribulokinase n=1 Tax=Aquisalinus flavus TaxID=1526572 RepID=A0A8J2Y392_9PROT|nr:ribulokinase [Aquisalinus flavus]MBD0427417.1 ribulokinase [Aquisalinus flavus]UNE47220.1 ribulokinase [Aquisalinus flavus]GGD00842.1 ribulokinase [Aquisalinus flavus]
MSEQKLVLGLDYGTDSARAFLADALTGETLGMSVAPYERWSRRLYCEPAKDQYRQHPQDYIDALEASVADALAQAGEGAGQNVVGISFDTTGSTPCLVDEAGIPLALRDDFAEEPDAMFVLWKDHTAIREAEHINTLSKTWNTDYLKYVGGIYSSEWVLAKMAHVLKGNDRVHNVARAWIEHCDWMPALLTGKVEPGEVRRGRCAAGHKALWAEEWGGLPEDGFLTAIEPRLAGYRERFSAETFTSDKPAGTILPEWADRLGISREAVVGIGAFDCHMGAVGGEVRPGSLSRVIGTSTCDIMIAPEETIGGRTVAGICGQVDGSVAPGYIGLEAGQSAFGDLYAWFADVLAWPLKNLMDDQAAAEAVREKLIPALSKAAEKIAPEESSVIAVDWMNGRRTPDASQAVKGAIAGLSLGSDAPRIFRALVEATCFGSRAIVERFRREGIAIDDVIALGGVAQKSPLVMQIMADVLNMPIRVARSEQTCALGAAMFAAIASGVHKSVEEAQSAMGQGFEAEYTPDPARAAWYDKVYQQHYAPFGQFIETTLTA